MHEPDKLAQATLKKFSKRYEILVSREICVSGIDLIAGSLF